MIKNLIKIKEIPFSPQRKQIINNWNMKNSYGMPSFVDGKMLKEWKNYKYNDNYEFSISQRDGLMNYEINWKRPNLDIFRSVKYYGTPPAAILIFKNKKLIISAPYKKAEYDLNLLLKSEKWFETKLAKKMIETLIQSETNKKNYLSKQKSKFPNKIILVVKALEGDSKNIISTFYESEKKFAKNSKEDRVLKKLMIDRPNDKKMNLLRDGSIDIEQWIDEEIIKPKKSNQLDLKKLKEESKKDIPNSKTKQIQTK